DLVMADFATGHAAGKSETAHRAVRIHRFPVGPPSLFAGRDRWNFPADPSRVFVARHRPAKRLAVLHHHEAMLAIGLPVEIRGQRGQRAEALLGFPQRQFGAAAVRDVHHDPPQLHYHAILYHHRHQVTQPDGAAIRRDHAVLELVIALLRGGARAILGGPADILRVRVVTPEIRLEPLARRIT